MANTSSEGFVSTASRRAAASGRAFRAYQTKDVEQLYRELLHKRYKKYAFSWCFLTVQPSAGSYLKPIS